MYFEAEKKELEKLQEEKVRQIKLHDDKIKELELKLDELKVSSQEALESGKDELFVKLGGQIAVTEAQLKKERDLEKFVATPDITKSFRDDVKEAYEKEMGKKITKVFKCCDELIKLADEIGDIFSSMEDVACLYNELVGYREEGFPRGDVSDVRALREFIIKAIDPLADKPTASKSIRSFALRLDYEGGSRK